MPDLAGDAEKSRSAKISLRNRLITERRSLSRPALAAAAAAVQDQILALVRREAAATVAAYVPIGAEPGGPALPSAVAGVVSRLLLPVLLPSGDLDWATFEGSLVAGPRGLLQPPGPRLGVSAIRSAAVVIVPALAVDRSGMRMGRGGGSYDRSLARLAGTSAQVIALLHANELVPAVPAEPHDRPVHAAVTPRELTIFATPGTLNQAAEWTK